MRSLLFPLALAVSACDTAPIEWSDPIAVSAPDANARLRVDSAGVISFAVDSTTVMPPPAGARMCRTSLRTAVGTKAVYAAWWSVRPDSSAVLYSSRSEDRGKSWGTPAAVDTSDISSLGCRRPAPSLATSGDDLHTAYSMIAPDGTGVFFAHYMGSMLHSPVAVIYGDRLVETAIAADGDRVAVAYEEPNGTRQQVDVAVSLTQGHIFERHSAASRSIDLAKTPAVAIRGDRVAVAWVTKRVADTSGTTVARVGRIR
jgi:hypothetical protein